jgi:hypothetical protein
MEEQSAEKSSSIRESAEKSSSIRESAEGKNQTSVQGLSSEQTRIKKLSIDKKLSLEERNHLIIYIDEYVDKLAHKPKCEILTRIKNSIDPGMIKYKGGGTQIKYSNIPNNTLIWISNTITDLLETTR